MFYKNTNMNLLIRNHGSLLLICLLASIALALLVVPFVGAQSSTVNGGGSGGGSTQFTSSNSNEEILDHVCRIDPDDPGLPNNSAERDTCRRIIGENLQQCRQYTGDPTEEAEYINNCIQNVVDNSRRIIQQRLSAERRAEEAQELATGDFDGDCSESLHPDDCGIMAYIRIITDGLTVIVGVVVTGMLIFGGIQYSAAGSNPQMVQAAKGHISQALLALVIWIFMAAFLQWLIPGGIF